MLFFSSRLICDRVTDKRIMAAAMALGGMFSSGVSLAAASQTAGETAAFILYGLEDGQSFLTADGQRVNVEQKAREPSTVYIMTYSGSGSTRERKFTISQIDSCSFEVGVENDGSNASKTQFDFNHLISVTRNDPFYSVNFNGQCPIKEVANEDCRSSHLTLPEYGRDLSRMKNAISYFKSSFCSGSAF